MSDSSRQFRAAKARLFKRTLEPAGFIKGSHLFIRETAGQIHGIHFQTSKYGGSYFVNVAFHYDFLPAIMEIANGTAVPLERFHVLDFMLHSRLGLLMPGPYPKEWDYEDTAALDGQVESIARDAIAVLDALSLRWRDPSAFLDLLPPRLLDEDYKTEPDDSAESGPVGRALGPGWGPIDYFSLGYCLCVIALRAGCVDFAKEYLRILEYDRRGSGAKAIAELTRQVEAAVRHD